MINNHIVTLCQPSLVGRRRRVHTPYEPERKPKLMQGRDGSAVRIRTTPAPTIVEVAPVPNARVYVISAHDGEPAMKVELNTDLYPVEWHARILRDMERRYVYRRRPPIRLQGTKASPIPLLKAALDDPYGLGRTPSKPEEWDSLGEPPPAR